MQRGTIYCTSMAHTRIHDKTDKDDSQHIMPPCVPRYHRENSNFIHKSYSVNYDVDTKSSFSAYPTIIRIAINRMISALMTFEHFSSEEL
jgi:hypothetical protein